MIIGNGFIASLFKNNDNENIIFFASGVSNSLEKDKKAFRREEKLLRETIKENINKLVVYFSTCSIYDSSKNKSAYVLHKIRMESIVKEIAPNYLVLRVSNAIGKGGNSNLLLNYLIGNIRKNTAINLHTKASRNLINVEDLKAITLQLLANKYKNNIINVASPHNYTMYEIISNIEKTTGIKATINPIEIGNKYTIAIPEVKNYFIQKNKTDKMNYLICLLKKYYIKKR